MLRNLGRGRWAWRRAPAHVDPVVEVTQPKHGVEAFQAKVNDVRDYCHCQDYFATMKVRATRVTMPVSIKAQIFAYCGVSLVTFLKGEKQNERKKGERGVRKLVKREMDVTGILDCALILLYVCILCDMHAFAPIVHCTHKKNREPKSNA